MVPRLPYIVYWHYIVVHKLVSNILQPDKLYEGLVQEQAEIREGL